MTRQVSIEKQLRDLETLIVILRHGGKLNPSEFEFLEPGLMAATDTLRLCRGDHRETIRLSRRSSGGRRHE
jgi:hypothetical protein